MPYETIDLRGKVALVTGASRGIGRAVAIGLAKCGLDVAVNYRERSAEAAVACAEIEGLGRRSVAVQADVAQDREVARLVGTVEKALGTVDVLVNNAGIARVQSIEDITEEDWDELLRVNVKSAFLVTRRVLPGMRARRWGRIVNVSSAAAHVGGVVGPHYAASKAALLGFTHWCARVLAKEGITANAVAPALVATDMIPPGLRPDLIPQGRFGTPDEVAEAVVMLVRNAYVTGQTINVDGGVYMT